MITTINNNPSARIDMLHRKGNAFTFAVRLVDDQGAALDISAFQFEMKLYSDAGSALLTFSNNQGLEINNAGNQLAFAVPIETIDALPQAAYNYELYYTTNDGNVSLLHGKLKIVDSAHKVSLSSIAQNGSVFSISLGDQSTISLPIQVGMQGPQGIQGEQGIAGSGYSATSETSLTIGTGSFQLSTRSGLAYLPGMRIRLAANPSNYMEGIVTSYSNSSLILSVDYVRGGGTYSSWSIGIAGEIGSLGPTGPQGPTGDTGPQGPAGVSADIDDLFLHLLF